MHCSDARVTPGPRGVEKGNSQISHGHEPCKRGLIANLRGRITSKEGIHTIQVLETSNLKHVLEYSPAMIAGHYRYVPKADATDQSPYHSL